MEWLTSFRSVGIRLKNEDVQSEKLKNINVYSIYCYARMEFRNKKEVPV
jgi:hypothetical protein